MYVRDHDGEEALLLVGHGTRDGRGVRRFRETARLVADRWEAGPVEPCFLELASPTIDEAIERLVRQHARRIVVAPLLLFAAGHAKQDIPGQVHTAVERISHVELSIRFAPPLGCHRRLLELSAARYAEAVGEADTAQTGMSVPPRILPLPMGEGLGEGVAGLARVQPNRGASEFSRIQLHAQTGMSVPPRILPLPMGEGRGEGVAELARVQPSGGDTLLVFVGRGSSDPEAIAQMHRFVRLRREITPVGDVLTCFCAAARPSLDEAIKTAQTSSAERIVIQPHLLFEGAVMDSVRQSVAVAAAADRSRAWTVVDVLGPSDSLAAAIVETAGRQPAPGVNYLST